MAWLHACVFVFECAILWRQPVSRHIYIYTARLEDLMSAEGMHLVWRGVTFMTRVNYNDMALANHV